MRSAEEIIETETDVLKDSVNKQTNTSSYWYLLSWVWLQMLSVSFGIDLIIKTIKEKYIYLGSQGEWV